MHHPLPRSPRCLGGSAFLRRGVHTEPRRPVPDRLRSSARGIPATGATPPPRPGGSEGRAAEPPTTAPALGRQALPAAEPAAPRGRPRCGAAAPPGGRADPGAPPPPPPRGLPLRLARSAAEQGSPRQAGGWPRHGGGGGVPTAQQGGDAAQGTARPAGPGRAGLPPPAFPRVPSPPLHRGCHGDRLPPGGTVLRKWGLGAAGTPGMPPLGRPLGPGARERLLVSGPWTASPAPAGPDRTPAPRAQPKWRWCRTAPEGRRRGDLTKVGHLSPLLRSYLFGVAGFGVFYR